VFSVSFVVINSPSVLSTSSAFSSALIDHDLLSSMKIGTVLYARKDAETTNAGSLGAKAGGRRRTSIA
jgi:hypothetical protein